MPQSIDDYSVAALEQGYAQSTPGSFTCLECGAHFHADEVYPVDGRYFMAEKAARHHAQTAHGNRLENLLASGARQLSLTEHQKNLLRLFAAGHTDAEIAAETGTAPATVRRQRFAFREKARQAKTYLAVHALATQRPPADEDSYLPLPEGVRLFDERFMLTRAENERYLKNAFTSLEPPVLKAIPVKEKKKVAVLNLIAAQFQPGVDYSEAQVNATLKAIHPEDYVTLRRYLIEYRFLARTPSGSRYWRT